MSLDLDESMLFLDVGNQVQALHDIKPRKARFLDNVGGIGYRELFAQNQSSVRKGTSGARIRSMLD
jgi:hypothetical protein